MDTQYETLRKLREVNQTKTAKFCLRFEIPMVFLLTLKTSH